MPPTALDRIRDGLAAAADGSAVAVGWATVDLDRAAAELAGALGLTPDVFVPADDSIVLGAACRVATGVLPTAARSRSSSPSPRAGWRARSPGSARDRPPSG